MAVMMVRARSTSGSIVEAARALDAALERAARTGDAARLVRDCYAETGRLVPPHGPGVRGRDQVRACWRGIFDRGLADVALDTPDVVGTGDVAYGIGRYTLVYRPYDGPASRDAGRRVVAYRRGPDGRWAVTADIWTGDGVQAEAPDPPIEARGGRWRGCRRGAESAREGCRRARAGGRRLARSIGQDGATA